MIFNSIPVTRLIELAINEDVGLGDVTTELIIDPDQRSEASILVKEDLVVCGLPIVDRIFDIAGLDAQVSVEFEEGAQVLDGTTIARIVAPTQDLLTYERTILNFLQRLCGVASLSRRYSEKCEGMMVLDTRKTTPGWRSLEKYGVRVGGCRNHRYGLGDLILVKNNHIDAHPAGLEGALRAVRSGKAPYLPVEVEVRNLEELEVALSFVPNIVMLDNMDLSTIKRAIRRIKALQTPVAIEVSGGVDIEQLDQLHAAGVDCVSVGALTNQVVSVDISLRITRTWR